MVKQNKTPRIPTGGPQTQPASLHLDNHRFTPSVLCISPLSLVHSRKHTHTHTHRTQEERGWFCKDSALVGECPTAPELPPSIVQTHPRSAPGSTPAKDPQHRQWTAARRAPAPSQTTIFLTSRWMIPEPTPLQPKSRRVSGATWRGRR